MLDIVPSPETSRPCSMLSLDFSPYLLSASPPNSGFSLDNLSLTSNYTPYFFSAPPSRPSSACTKVYGTSYAHKNPSLKSIMSANAKDIQAPNESTPSFEGSTSAAETGSICSSRNVKKLKRVKFADDVGRPLAEVRVMLDNPTAPPLLSFRTFPDTQANGEENAQPLLIAPDPQPLYRPNFEEDLQRNLVAVENVLVDRFDLTCTIQVSNQPSSKRVFGRCTMDSWQNHQDVQASYSQAVRPGVDRYSFSLTIPTSSDRSKSIQFAVCYEADGTQNWDNNEGNNFILRWNEKAEEKPFEDSNANNLDYGGFVWCSHDDLDRPYY